MAGEREHPASNDVLVEIERLCASIRTDFRRLRIWVPIYTGVLVAAIAFVTRLTI